MTAMSAVHSFKPAASPEGVRPLARFRRLWRSDWSPLCASRVMVQDNENPA